MSHSKKRKSSGRRNLRLCSDLLGQKEEGPLSQNKRRRLFSTNTENDFSSDRSSEGTSDSEFEEHPYSRPVSQTSKRLHHPRTKTRLNFDFNVHSSHLDGDFKDSRKSKCTSKNAVMARLNRLKKKKYIEDLEKKTAELEVETRMLRKMLDKKTKEIESLKRETLNLQNVIRNSTEIGSLLRCVRQNTDLEISSSLLKIAPTGKCLPTTKPNLNVHAEAPSSSNVCELKESSAEGEALVAAILWGMALHTFCQPYKAQLNFKEIFKCT